VFGDGVWSFVGDEVRGSSDLAQSQIAGVVLMAGVELRTGEGAIFGACGG
jgi:hypothetical protein